MGKFSQLGNDLYDGRGLDRLRRPQVALVRHLRRDRARSRSLGLYFKGLNFGIEFEGGAQYTRLAAQRPGRPRTTPTSSATPSPAPASTRRQQRRS